MSTPGAGKRDPIAAAAQRAEQRRRDRKEGHGRTEALAAAQVSEPICDGVNDVGPAFVARTALTTTATHRAQDEREPVDAVVDGAIFYARENVQIAERVAHANDATDCRNCQMSPRVHTLNRCHRVAEQRHQRERRSPRRRRRPRRRRKLRPGPSRRNGPPRRRRRDADRGEGSLRSTRRSWRAAVRRPGSCVRTSR